MLSQEESSRYFKQMQLDEVGLHGQLALKKAKVAVVGAGGLGCPILQYLSAVGVGTIGVIDFDKVDVSNLHRQILYSSLDIGEHKSDVAINKLSLLNPFTKFVNHKVLLSNDNASSILSQYDLVIDGCDNFLTRYTVNDCCVQLDKPLVYGSILGFQGQIAVFNYCGSKNLRDIFPEPPEASDVPNCSENGVLGTVPGIMGNMMAQLSLHIILGIKVPVNELFLLDLIRFKLTGCRF